MVVWRAIEISSFCYSLIGLVGRVFAIDLGDLSSIPGRVHNKDFKNGTWYLLA